jgi:hypothetical protein
METAYGQRTEALSCQLDSRAIQRFIAVGDTIATMVPAAHISVGRLALDAYAA